MFFRCQNFIPAHYVFRGLTSENGQTLVSTIKHKRNRQMQQMSITSLKLVGLIVLKLASLLGLGGEQ